MLQAQLVADLKGLPHSPYDSHSLTLGRKKESSEGCRDSTRTHQTVVAEDAQGDQKPRQPEKEKRQKYPASLRCIGILERAPVSPQSSGNRHLKTGARGKGFHSGLRT